MESLQVPRFAAFQMPSGNGHQPREQGGGSGEQQSAGDSLAQQRSHGAVVGQGVAEFAARHGSQPGGVAHRQRTVQTMPGAQGLDSSRGRRAGRVAFRRRNRRARDRRKGRRGRRLRPAGRGCGARRAQRTSCRLRAGAWGRRLPAAALQAACGRLRRRRISQRLMPAVLRAPGAAISSRVCGCRGWLISVAAGAYSTMRRAPSRRSRGPARRPA